jgi:hypothetical protein
MSAWISRLASSNSAGKTGGCVAHRTMLIFDYFSNTTSRLDEFHERP